MKPPVRIVCRGCLRSVEVDEDVESPPSGSCPYCGQALDSRQGLSGGITEDTDSAVAASEGARKDREATSEWIATWTRGSLGVLNRFQLRDRLGDGGFGEVFLAYDPRLDRDVAVKVLRQANPSDRVMERFFREARAAARLDHPNIVAVYDSGFDRGRCWVAYQYVSGRPLWWFFDHQPIEPLAAARLIRDLADAVDYAHKHGVVHRDIKPANILIDELMRPRLIDFGLARRADLDSSLTRDGAVIGTPAYMSPEQALGQSRQVDERSDVFSLGVVLFEALAGRRPHSATTIRTPPHGRVPAVDAAPAEDWSGVDADVPAGLVEVCKKATADRPEGRYPTARALADALESWIRTHEAPARARRRPAALPLVAGAALLAFGLVVGYLAASRGGASATAAPLAKADPAPEDDSPAKSAAPADAKPPARAAGVEGRLVGNLKGRRYHLSSCEDVKMMAPANRVAIAKPEEAAAKGLSPCDHCHPPEAKRPAVRSASKS